MNNSQTSQKTRTGFQNFSAEDINASDKIKIRDVEDIAKALGIRLPCNSNQKTQILQFATDAASAGMTIKQGINAYQKVKEEASSNQGNNSAPTGSWSQEPSMEAEFSGAEQQLIELADLQNLQNQLAVAETEGIQIGAALLAARANGVLHMQKLSLGFVAPRDDSEAALLSLVSRAQGVGRKNLLPFMQLGMNGDRPQMKFQALGAGSSPMTQALQLMAASEGSGIIPQTPLAQLMEQLQSGKMPTLQATPSILPQLAAAPTETQAIAEELAPEQTTKVAVEDLEPSPAPTDL